MAVGLVIFVCLCGWLLVQHVRGILQIRSLCRQLEEIRQGSHMELGIASRQKEMLSLCRILNQLLRQQGREQRQYMQAEKQLKQNITSLAHDIRTPLTGAAGYVQLAQECREPARQERYLQIASERMQELSDMLKLTLI